jgi:hypothetical protein
MKAKLSSSSSTRIRGGAIMQLMGFLICVVGMVALGWMLLLPGLFTSVIEKRTGFPARVDYFYANPFTSEVRLRGLVVVNPDGFQGELLELRQFTAKADLFTLLSDRPVIDMSMVDVARISVVTNVGGVNNLDLLYRRLGGTVDKKVKPAATGAASTTLADAPLNFLIRSLDMRLGEVVVADDRTGKVSKQALAVNYQRTYRNVTRATNFASDLSPELVNAGKLVSAVVPGSLGVAIGDATREGPRSTYAFRKRAEIEAEAAAKLEQSPKP